MNKEKSNHKKIAWDKLVPELQKQLDEEGKDQLKKAELDLDQADLDHLQSLQTRISKNLYHEIKKAVSIIKRQSLQQAKQIVLNLEIIPFQLATRSTAIEQFGRPWRHDGGSVTFKLQMPHDKLEIYSTRGEYLCSYPVQSTGEVKIDDLEAGVYLIYLQGRKITEME
jgi:hypothetical protein